MAVSRPNILLCASGSVAAVKVPELYVNLSQIGTVKIVASKSGLYFMKRSSSYNCDIWAEFCSRSGLDNVYIDEDEWFWEAMGDTVLHITLSQWADIILLAPASADTIAKVSVGICDNLLLCVLRAKDLKTPAILAPAMNTAMWNHPSTQPALDTLTSWQWRVVPPQVKRLACDVVGIGAMAAVDDIINLVGEVCAMVDITNRPAIKCTDHLPLSRHARDALFT